MLDPICHGCAECSPAIAAREEAFMRAEDVRMANEQAAIARQAAILETDPDAEFCSLDCDGDHDGGW